MSPPIRNANSIAFVSGVPVYERYFLGSENDIRGYNSRSIGPIAPFDTYITARNVSVSSAISGTRPIAGSSRSLRPSRHWPSAPRLRAAQAISWI